MTKKIKTKNKLYLEKSFNFSVRFWENIIPYFSIFWSKKVDHAGLSFEFSWLFVDASVQFINNNHTAYQRKLYDVKLPYKYKHDIKLSFYKDDIVIFKFIFYKGISIGIFNYCIELVYDYYEEN